MTTTDIPLRNPLHKRALTEWELFPGLHVQKYHHHQPLDRVGEIRGVPFVHEASYGRRVWWVEVSTTDSRGNPRVEKWSLGDMGVAPYENPNGSQWNSANYTLAALSTVLRPTVWQAIAKMWRSAFSK